MVSEGRVYVKFGELQGHGIPKLKAAGNTTGRPFALMADIVSELFEGERLDDKVREMIVGVLASVHRKKVLHRDVRCDNILIEYCHDGPRITFIDFGVSRKFSIRKESVGEMTALKKMLCDPQQHAAVNSFFPFFRIFVVLIGVNTVEHLVNINAFSDAKYYAHRLGLVSIPPICSVHLKATICPHRFPDWHRSLEIRCVTQADSQGGGR
jgi:serine/threonine protein kinase